MSVWLGVHRCLYAVGGMGDYHYNTSGISPCSDKQWHELPAVAEVTEVQAVAQVPAVAEVTEVQALAPEHT